MRVSLTFLLGFFLIASCDAPVMPLPGTTGKAGELVVVMDDALWEAPLGDSVHAALTASVYGLPQPEPMFDAVHIRTEAFTKIFQTHRNILMMNVVAGQSPSIEVRTDVWATPQLVIEAMAPDAEELMRLFEVNRDRITAHFLKKEEERNRESYRKQPMHDAVDALQTHMHVNLPIPKGFKVISQKDDFVWVRYDTKDINQSILVYSEPYTRQNTFTEEGMIAVMDAFCKVNVPGSVDGSFMKTFLEYPPRFAETTVSDVYASELRGLWNVEGDIMGGPFICYAFLDEPRNRVVYLHGFVFAPGKDKRNLMVQLRSILKGAQLL